MSRGPTDFTTMADNDMDMGEMMDVDETPENSRTVAGENLDNGER